MRDGKKDLGFVSWIDELNPAQAPCCQKLNWAVEWSRQEIRGLCQNQGPWEEIQRNGICTEERGPRKRSKHVARPCNPHWVPECHWKGCEGLDKWYAKTEARVSRDKSCFWGFRTECRRKIRRSDNWHWWHNFKPQSFKRWNLAPIEWYSVRLEKAVAKPIKDRGYDNWEQEADWDPAKHDDNARAGARWELGGQSIRKSKHQASHPAGGSIQTLHGPDWHAQEDSRPVEGNDQEDLREDCSTRAAK